MMHIWIVVSSIISLALIVDYSLNKKIVGNLEAQIKERDRLLENADREIAKLDAKIKAMKAGSSLVP